MIVLLHMKLLPLFIDQIEEEEDGYIGEAKNSLPSGDITALVQHYTELRHLQHVIEAGFFVSLSLAVCQSTC